MRVKMKGRQVPRLTTNNVSNDDSHCNYFFMTRIVQLVITKDIL